MVPTRPCHAKMPCGHSFSVLGAKAHEELVRALRGRARLLEAHVRLEEGELFPLIALRAAIRRKQRLEAVPATRELMDAGAVEL